jgi:3-phosphoinositide dependent protein kinase-1
MLSLNLKKERIYQRFSIEQEKFKNNMEDSASSFTPSSDEEDKDDPQEITTIEKSTTVNDEKLSMNDYEMLGIIGEGAFGRVHHVVKKSDGEEYAIKLVVKKDMTKKMQTEVQRERYILMKVKHPNIIRLHQAFHDPKNLYFVMDLAENGELFSYMKNEGALDYKIAQFLAAEMVNMVAYMQSMLICHRDIKPGNVLFDKNMHLKLIDFGSGKFYNNDVVEQVQDLNNQSGSSEEKGIKRMNTFIGT